MYKAADVGSYTVLSRLNCHTPRERCERPLYHVILPGGRRLPTPTALQGARQAAMSSTVTAHRAAGETVEASENQQVVVAVVWSWKQVAPERS